MSKIKSANKFPPNKVRSLSVLHSSPLFFRSHLRSYYQIIFYDLFTHCISITQESFTFCFLLYSLFYFVTSRDLKDSNPVFNLTGDQLLYLPNIFLNIHFSDQESKEQSISPNSLMFYFMSNRDFSVYPYLSCPLLSYFPVF